MATYERDGQRWETRNNHYGWYKGEPCKIVDLLGDFDTYCALETVLLHAEHLDGGWVRYWLSSSDAEMRESIASLTQ